VINGSKFLNELFSSSFRQRDCHIRSLQAEHLTDVLTSDQHTVKPWLSARPNVSPPVLELRDAGFPLVGVSRITSMGILPR
jgi:anti-sigma factor RsiW